MSFAQAQTPLDAALGWAERGYPVLPLHSVDSRGRCSCLKRCAHAGKHPRFRTGRDFAAASADVPRIREWWQEWPDSNVGIPTGRRTDLFVVDLDAEGDQWQKVEFVTGHGIAGAAVIIGTGTGGRHYWFSRPDVAARLAHGGDAAPFGIDGIHFRCDGGLVVVPPSRNAAGPYALLEADFDDLWPPRAELVEMLLSRAKAKGVGQVIPQGARNMTLTSLAGTMRYAGMEEAEIAAGLLEVNARRCKPPLPEGEVRTIAESVSGYPPGRPPDEYVRLPKALVLDGSVSARACRVYAGYALHADWHGARAGHTVVAVGKVAGKLSLSEATVTRGLSELGGAGWVERAPQGACRTAETVLRTEARPPASGAE